MGNTLVVNVTGAVPVSDVCDVYIGRDYGGWKDVGFGNKVSTVAESGSRAQAIVKYKKWFFKRVNNDEAFAKKIEALRGKKLGCWCAPKQCHGDVIVAYLEYADSQ